MVEELTAAIDDLVENGPAALGDGETVVKLLRQLSRLQAVTARASASFDASGEWRADGARSAGAWLAHRTRLPAFLAHRFVRAGRLAEDLDEVRGAWQGGAISIDHVAAFLRASTPVTAELMEAHQ